MSLTYRRSYRRERRSLTPDAPSDLSPASNREYCPLINLTQVRTTSMTLRQQDRPGSVRRSRQTHSSSPPGLFPPKLWMS